MAGDPKRILSRTSRLRVNKIRKIKHFTPQDAGFPGDWVPFGRRATTLAMANDVAREAAERFGILERDIVFSDAPSRSSSFGSGGFTVFVNHIGVRREAKRGK